MLDELKGRLRITWDDEDKNLLELIEKSKSYLSNLTNATFDFDKENWVKDLLLERCRYAYNNALDEFEPNFSHELKRLTLSVALGRVGNLEQKNTEDI